MRAGLQKPRLRCECDKPWVLDELDHGHTIIEHSRDPGM